MYVPCLSKPVISHIEEEAMSLFDILLFLIALFSEAVAVSAHLCIICLLSNVAVSSSCHLSEFVFSMASFINSNESFFLYDCVLCPPFFFRVVLLCLFELLFRGPNRPRNG